MIKSLGYTVKTVLTAILSTLFAVTMVLIVTTRKFNEGINEVNVEKIQSNSDFAALSIASPYVFYNKLLLDSFIDSFMTNNYIQYAYIVDFSDNVILSHSSAEKIGTQYSPSKQVELISGTLKHGIMKIDDNLYESLSPIIIDSNIFGSLVVGFSVNGISETTAPFVLRVLTISSMVIFLSIISVLIISYMINRPLKELSLHVKEISKGSMNRPFSYYRGNDIVGELSKAIEKMVYELEENYSMIKYNEEIYKAIFDSSNDAILIMDGFIIEESNSRCIELFGYKPEEMRGCSLLEFAPQVQPHAVSSHTVLKDKLDLIDGQERLRFYFVLNRGDHLRWDAEVSMSPAEINGKKMILVVIQDITARKSSELEISFLNKHLEQRVRERTNELELIQSDMQKLIEDLEGSNKALEKVNQDKTIFLKTMSHEIKTPLNVIMGFLKLMSDMETLPEGVTSYVNTALDSSKGLMSLIGDIMDLNRLEDKEIDLTIESFYLPDYIEDLLIPYFIKAKEKGLELKLDIDKKLHCCIDSDHIQLKKIICNLMDNAIKFTLKGSISLTVTMNTLGSLEFIIRDTGIGMSDEDQQSIFTPFVQVDQSSTRSFGGTGLGITISKYLCELMGGQLYVDSLIGEGSKFWFTIPGLITSCGRENCLGCDKRHLKPHEINKTEKKRCKILLAEDIDENAKLLMIHVKNKGYSIDWVKNGLEAVRLVAQRPYDCILMDVNMPIMDGLDATKEIRKLDINIPIIALTAGLTATEQEIYYSIGMDAVIGKPIDFTLLWRKINQLTSYKEEIKRDNVEYIDIERGFETWLSMKDYIGALSSFYDKYKNHVDILKKLFDASDIKEMHFIIHALKGVSGNLSLPKLEEVTKEFDMYVKKDEIGMFRANIKNIYDIMEDTLSQINTVVSDYHKEDVIADQIIDSSRLSELTPELNRLKSNFLYGDVDDTFVSNILESLVGKVELDTINQLKESIDQYNLDDAVDIIDRIIPE